MKIKTLHIEFTTACNSKCIMCDYWKINEKKMINSNLVLSVIANQMPLGLTKIYFTGGECLVFADELFLLVKQIRNLFPSLKLGLITNGILLKKYYQEVSDLFEKVIISLDTIDREIYKAIRGIDGVDIIKSGILQIKGYNPQTQVNLRVLVLDETMQGIPQIIDFALNHKIDRISFIPEDIGSDAAFGRDKESIIFNHSSDILLSDFRNVINHIKVTYASEIGNLLRVDLDDLERIYSIYSGQNISFPLCNKPTASCVVSVDGLVSPCFFIAGEQYITDKRKLSDILFDREYRKCVQNINGGQFPVCRTCACPKELS